MGWQISERLLAKNQTTGIHRPLTRPSLMQSALQSYQQVFHCFATMKDQHNHRSYQFQMMYFTANADSQTTANKTVQK